MSRSELLLEATNKFYDDPKNLEILKSILEKKSSVSLRNLEWFITDYSKRKNLVYETKTGKTFNVHLAYKSSLDGYSKKLFDPFCRTTKIEYKGLSTTPAQLNFIAWAIKNDVIDNFEKLDPNEKKIKGC
jgi:hypothetical protein